MVRGLSTFQSYLTYLSVSFDPCSWVGGLLTRLLFFPLLVDLVFSLSASLVLLCLSSFELDFDFDFDFDFCTARAFFLF